MNTQPDDFQELRKLLALKRHEQPPPRYFNEFSSQVIARLRKPEVVARPTLLERLGFDFNLRPAMVCGLGVVISALLLTGTIKSIQMEPLPSSAFQAMGNAPMDQGEASWGSGSMLVSGVSGTASREAPSSTVPVFNAPATSPFSQIAVQAAKASWAFGRSQN